MNLTRFNRHLPGFGLSGLAGLAIVLVAALALFLSYQVRPTYTVNMGSDFDHLYLLDGFYAIETNPDHLVYRWTSGFSKLEIKGVARQPLKLKIEMEQSSLDPHQGKNVKVELRGALLALFQVSPRRNTYDIDIPPELISRFSGDLTFIISTDTFQPKGERRALGVVITSVTVEPVGSAGVILPPLQQYLYLAGMGLAVFLLGLILRLGWRWRLGTSLGFVALGGVGYAALRQGFTFYTGSLLIALLLAGVATLVAQPVISWWFRRGGLPAFKISSGEGRWLFILFGVGLAIAWAGLLYPYSEPNDFGFHLNRFRMVQQGDLYFDYIISGVGHSFYPPAMYVLFVPFSVFFSDAFFLIKLAPALFNFLAIFPVYFLVKRYFGFLKYAALLAAAFFTVIPVNLLVIWWAHDTNVFGLVIMLAALVYLLELYERLAWWPVWLGLVVLFFLVLMSHPAILVFGGVYFPFLILVLLALQRAYRAGSLKPIVALASAFVAAGLLAFFLYYLHYLPTLGQSTTETGNNELASSLSALNNLGGMLNLIRLTFDIGFLGDYALLPLLIAPFGLVVLFRRKGIEPEADKPAWPVVRVRWALLSWLVVGLGGLLITFVTSLSLRPMLFVWPVVAILDGLALAAFIEGAFVKFGPGAGRWRGAIVWILLAGLFGLSSYFWFTANYLGQQPPHVF
jgi:hypothetical protein